MVDLTGEMASLWAALGPPPPQGGRVLQFVSATSGEGASTVAREFARLAAVRARRPVWLVDADLQEQRQLEAVGADADRFGRLGREAGASPDGAACFFTVQPPVRDRAGAAVADARLLIARPALGGRLWITRVRRESLHSGQRTHLLPTEAYWKALRRHADYVIVDSPAADRSEAAAVLAPLVDVTVLVVAAESASARAPAALRDSIETAGGRVAGLVFNRASVETPKLLKRLLP